MQLSCRGFFIMQQLTYSVSLDVWTQIRIKPGIKNLLLIVGYVFITPWWPVNKLEWYIVIILSMHTSGIANSVLSLFGVLMILNKKESNNIYLSANIFTFQYMINVLKYELTRYPACISFKVTDKCVPLRTFLWIIFNILSISACFSLPVLFRCYKSWGSWKYDLPDLWYISDITPSWNPEFSLISVFISGSMSNKPPGI